MLTLPEAFVEPPGGSGCPYARIHLKKKAIYHTHPLSKVCDKSMSQFGSGSIEPRNTSPTLAVLFARRIGSCGLVAQGRLTWVTGSLHTCPTRWDRHSSNLRGTFPLANTRSALASGSRPPGSNPLQSGFLVECQLIPRHLGECQAFQGRGPASWLAFKKALCHTHTLGGARDKYHEPA